MWGGGASLLLGCVIDPDEGFLNGSSKWSWFVSSCWTTFTTLSHHLEKHTDTLLLLLLDQPWTLTPPPSSPAAAPPSPQTSYLAEPLLVAACIKTNKTIINASSIALFIMKSQSSAGKKRKLRSRKEWKSTQIKIDWDSETDKRRNKHQCAFRSFTRER